MKFSIVSDTHDNMKNFNKVIDWLNKEKIELMLHCGDISTEDTIKQAEEKFNGEIQFVEGNADVGIKGLPDTLDLDIGGKKIGVVHYDDLAKKLAESGKYDLVFHGHTHKPWEEKIGNPSTSSGRVCRLINPGEVAGQRYVSTFAVYDTEKDSLELKVLQKLAR